MSPQCQTKSLGGIGLFNLGLLCQRCIVNVLQCAPWAKNPLSELRNRDWPSFFPPCSPTLAWFSYLLRWHRRTIWKVAAHQLESANCPSDGGEHVSYGQSSRKLEVSLSPSLSFSLYTRYHSSFYPFFLNVCFFLGCFLQGSRDKQPAA